MKQERFEMHATVALLLIKDNKVLLMKRCNTGYMDGYYGMISGHVEENESLKQAMIREAFEEVGIKIAEKNVEIICVIRSKKNDKYFNYFLTTKEYTGVPFIKEPDKCEELIWCPLEELPENTIIAEKRAVYNYLHEIKFDEYGFEKEKVLTLI